MTTTLAPTIPVPPRDRPQEILISEAKSRQWSKAQTRSSAWLGVRLRDRGETLAALVLLMIGLTSLVLALLGFLGSSIR